MRLNIKELLDFFDGKKDSQKGDANSLMAILGEDLNVAIYKDFRKNKVEVLEDSVLTGLKKGKRLDRWVLDGKKLYQCEIKNWAATAIGGKKLEAEADPKEIKEVSSYHWERELKTNLSDEADYPNGVNKVLGKMKPPVKCESFNVEPLLIYWMPITADSNGLDPLSVLSLKTLPNLAKNTKFSKLDIFSASLYLRQLYKQGKGQKFIDLDLPNFNRRLKLLTKLTSGDK